MTQYLCHKRVQAAKVVSVENGAALVTVKCDDGMSMTQAKNTGLLARYTPVVGDYLVEYSDGYQSFSPAKAFLEGYHEFILEIGP